ncbi:DeoR family transcriptional regulator [Rhodococcus opacus RKJ300 = JCM 13270]|uniref:DeoR family transcriptional regulator n=2 Tax=Nocardiaceae TaxID=85025 RepID=I0WNP0_RHOOP|nr:DeoR family transcriptional regulator [Rhodococcus opacus RKJ300 = JCM 13270]
MNKRMTSAQRSENLNQSDRHDAITELVLRSGSMRIEELADRFGVSVMTIHRDLDTLAAKGILRKSRGSVTAVATSLVEASIEYRTRQHQPEKQAIAHAAFELVEPGQAVILDDSTTGLALADLLPQRRPLTVITNSQRVLTTLNDQEGIALISTGGQYYQWCDAYMGAVTISALQALRADVFFMSTPAIIGDVCFHQHHETVQVKRAMFEAAQKRVLYADHTKFDQRALHAMAPLSDFDTVIVDAATDQEHIDRLRDAGNDVVVAKPGRRH